MRLGSPKRQIFGNLDVRMNILIGNERDFLKRIKQKVSEKKKVQMVPISLRRSLVFFFVFVFFFSIVWMCLN